MGKVDSAMNQYVATPERFAEIASYGIFHNTKVLSAEKLKELDGAGWRKNAATTVRDVVKMYDDKLCLMIVGIENQNRIHYFMPLRVMDYDVRSYVKQAKVIAKRHKEKKDLKTPEEVLSGFSREDKLIPVLTVVLYYGAKPWDGKMDLQGMLDIPEELITYREMIGNYKMHLIQINQMEEFDEFSDDLKRVFGFVKYQADQKALERYVEENKELFENISEEDSDAIKLLAGSKNLAECIEHSREGKVIHMCKAIKDWEAKSERIGEKRGERRGERQLLISQVSKKIQKGKTIPEIADALEMSEEEIQKVYYLAEKELEKSA